MIVAYNKGMELCGYTVMRPASYFQAKTACMWISDTKTHNYYSHNRPL